MAYNFGILNFSAFLKAKQWIKSGFGTYASGKPPLDNAIDNNYQNYSDNAAASGAIATFKEANALNQFEINNGHVVVDNALSLNQVAIPATPTAKTNGTAGSTTNAYKVVGRAGSLQAPSAAISKTTCAATLTTTDSVTITFVPTPGFLKYDIYRTAAGGTPSSTGRIGMIDAGFNTSNVTSPTLTFTDTGLTADGSTCPSTNTTGAFVGDLTVLGNLALTALGTPATPLATVKGTAGTSTITYKIVARSGSIVTATGHTAASSAVTVTTANGTLSATNYITLAWQPVVGAVTYDVYRVTTNGTSPTTTGLIKNTQLTTYDDIGGAGDSAVAPTTNTTGVSGIVSSTTPALASVNDTNAAVELNLTATSSAVNYWTMANGIAGTPGVVTLVADGASTNVSATITPKGTGVLKLAADGAAGTVLIGGTAQTGTITVGSSSATEAVAIAAGAGAPTVTVANTSILGATVTIASANTATGNTDTVTIAGGNSAGTGAKTVTIAGGVPAASGVDTVNIATGNAAATAAKVVNIATGIPNTSGNNQVMIGGGAKSAVTMNAVVTAYKATNLITATGGANALVGALLDANGSAVTVAAGLRVTVANGSYTLQAGANTFNLNTHGVDAIKKASAPTTDIAAIAANAYIDLIWNGTSWLVMGQ